MFFCVKEYLHFPSMCKNTKLGSVQTIFCLYKHMKTIPDMASKIWIINIIYWMCTHFSVIYVCLFIYLLSVCNNTSPPVSPWSVFITIPLMSMQYTSLRIIRGWMRTNQRVSFGCKFQVKGEKRHMASYIILHIS